MNNLLHGDYRCKCGKLLFKGIIFDGSLEIKCKRCGEYNLFETIKITADDSKYIIIYNSKGLIANVSSGACKVLGYTGDELLGKHFSLINRSVPVDIGLGFVGRESVLNYSHSLRYDTAHHSKNGKIIPIYSFLRLYKNHDGERCVMSFCYPKNISSSFGKLSEDIPELKKYKCEYYLDIDLSGHIVYVSPAIAKLVGKPQIKFIGMTVDKIISIPDDKLLAGFLKRHRSPCRYYSHLIINSPIKHNIELNCVPRVSSEGEPIGFSIIFWINSQNNI